MNVQEVPGIPHDVKVIDKSLLHVQLSWAAPDGDSSIQQYQIEYKISEGSWVKNGGRVPVPGKNNETAITELRPGTIYCLRIVAVNEIGKSKPSNTIRFITPEDAPSGPPTDVRVEVANSRALNVWWKPPKPALRNGKVLGYNVGYKRIDIEDAYIFHVAGSTRELGKDNHFQIGNLKSNTEYLVKVEAFNKVGSGPRSGALTKYTAEDALEQPPRNVTCTAITSQRIRVSWDSPPLTTIQGYKVIYRPTDLTDENMKDVEGTSSKTFIDGLHKYTNYSVQVLGYTAAGNGALSDPIQCQTEEDLPDKPTDIKVFVKSSESVVVSWKPPAKPNGIIEHYTLYVKQASDESNYKVQPTQLFYEFTKLDSSKSYEVYVTASTYMGEGKPSSTVLQSLADRRVPHSPRVILLSKTTTKITLKMQPNIRDTEPLHGYTIYYNSQSVKVTPPVENYTLKNLLGGKTYELYVKGYNSIGSGDDSKKLIVKTRGSAPIKPEHSQFITPLSYEVILNLDSWSDGGYPISNFKIEYREQKTILLPWHSCNTSPGGHYSIKSLHPSSPYIVKVTANNEVGSTTAKYIFNTLSYN